MNRPLIGMPHNQLCLYPVLILAYFLLPSDCFQFIEVSQNPLVVIIGQNSTDVKLHWEFDLDAGDHFNSLVINRYKDGQVDQTKVEMASYYSSGFTKTNNDTLYALNASGVSPRGFAIFLMKNILVQDPNKDGTKFDPLDPDVTYEYRITVTIPNLRPSTRENRIELQVKVPPKIIALFCQGCDSGSAIENQTITLLCNATGKPIPNIRWMKNGEYYNGSSTVSSSNNALVFQQVAIHDKGNYTCIADNGVGNPDRKSLTLFVKYKPKDTLLSPTKLDVCENTDITLNCTADAYPSVKNYSLYNGNTYFGSSSNGQFSTTARLLRWNKFCCVASNEIGSSQCAFSEVYVLEPPTITGCHINGSLNASQPVVEGDVVIVRCNGSGSPPLIRRWVKSGRVWNGNDLTFNPIHRKDAGSYNFTLNNGGECKEAVQHMKITVYYKPENTGIKITPDKKDFCKGESINISCKSDAKPAPLYSLYRNNVFNGNNGDGVFVVKLAENGNYTFTCEPYNTVGVGTNKSKSVTVKVRTLAPEITNPYKQELAVKEGKDVSLVCNASGYPVPNITWTKHGTVIGVGRIFNITRVKRNDSSCYTCTADNGIGHAKNVNICLDVQYPPSNINVLSSRRQMILKEGTSFSLYCQSDSNPPPTYTWKHNEVTSADGQNGILVFNSIKRKQNGTYQCEAKNPLGLLQSAPIEIVVQYIDPLEVIGSSNKSYSQSNPLVLFNLSINAYPSNTSMSCNSSAPNILTTITSHDAGLTRKQYLVFVVFQNDVDSASIVCKAENSVGVRERTFYFYRQPILFKETFTGQFRVTNQEWQDDLKDTKSADYNDLKQKCIKILEAAYSGVQYLAAINIKDFIKGSIIVRFELEVIGKVPDPLLPLREYIKRQGEEINGLQIDYNSIQKSNDQENTPIPCKGDNKTLVTVLGALFGLSIVLIIILIVGFLWLRRKDSKGNSGETSNTSDKKGQMNDISLQETSFNATDNETPNVPEYEPIGRRGLSTSNAGIPEYEAVTTRTQLSQPHSGVRTKIPMPQYESADQHGQTEAVSNPPPVTYQTIQHCTGNYDSLSPSTRLPHKSAVVPSTGSPTRTGEYQALQHKGVSPQYQSLDDLSKC